jgi:DNA mismatch repair ATPase MutL
VFRVWFIRIFLGRDKVTQLLHFVKDLEDLLHKLSEGAGSHVRCSRLDSKLASKACRMSIMIGDALDVGRMDKVCIF